MEMILYSTRHFNIPAFSMPFKDLIEEPSSASHHFNRRCQTLKLLTSIDAPASLYIMSDDLSTLRIGIIGMGEVSSLSASMILRLMISLVEPLPESTTDARQTIRLSSSVYTPLTVPVLLSITVSRRLPEVRAADTLPHCRSQGALPTRKSGKHVGAALNDLSLFVIVGIN